MKTHTAIKLALAAGLITGAHGAQVLHYWDMDTVDGSGVPQDTIGGIVTVEMDTPLYDNGTGSGYTSGYDSARGNFLQVRDGTAGHLEGTITPGDLDFGSGDFSFSYWSYDSSAGDASRGPRIFDFNASVSGGSSPGIQLGTNANAGGGYVYNLRIDTSSGVNVITNPTTGNITMPARDIWTHYAVNVSRSTNELSIFINGVLATASPLDISGLSGNVLPSTTEIEIGAINGGTNSNVRQHSGLDDLAFYNGTLSAGEVVGLVAGTLTPNQIPEPGSLLLLGLGALGVLRRRR